MRGTGVTHPFQYIGNQEGKNFLVAQTVGSWNRTLTWLHEMDLLRRAGSFRVA